MSAFRVVDHTPRMSNPVYASASQCPWDSKRWPNFKPGEIACHRTGKVVVHEPSLDLLQKLRTRIGSPFFVTSGYRSPEHNRTLRGAAKNSFHLEGIAFDINMRNLNPHEFFREAEAIGFDGIGTYPPKNGGNNFIHIDTRGYKARWGNPF